MGVIASLPGRRITSIIYLHTSKLPSFFKASQIFLGFCACSLFFWFKFQNKSVFDGQYKKLHHCRRKINMCSVHFTVSNTAMLNYDWAKIVQ
jgi:hypothetical protein